MRKFCSKNQEQHYDDGDKVNAKFSYEHRNENTDMLLRKKSIHKKMTFATIAIIAAFLIVVGRLFVLQIIEHEEYLKKAVNIQTTELTLTPSRGTIYDRNMKILAVSSTAYRITITPVNISTSQKELVAHKLSELLELDYDTVYRKVCQNTQYADIKRRVDKEIIDRLREFITENDINGIHIYEDPKRYYPNGTLASAILGFMGTDQGLQGLEAYYDASLKGITGRIVTAQKAAGMESVFDYELYVDAQDGENFVLTIDYSIQYFLENALKEAFHENQLNGNASGIVMNVNTGEILGLAVYPDYDLNDPFTLTDERILTELSQFSGEEYSKAYNNALYQMWRDPIISDAYIPGSAFKTITAAIALEEGVVEENSQFGCPGFLHVGGWDIHCWKRVGHGSQNFKKGFMNSCNCVFMKVGALIGRGTFQKYFEAFGFKEKTGVDLPGESSGTFWKDENFNEVELATAAFGQNFKITALQLVSAVSAVVNGGYLYEPQIVKARLSGDTVTYSAEPQLVRQVISEETSATMRNFLESVVSSGTGINAYAAGYSIGGKTATSEKTDEKNESGEVDKLIASFIGVAPMNDPEICVLIILDEPTGTLKQGGQIAAPVVGKVITHILDYLGYEPNYTEEQLAKLGTATPEVTNFKVSDAINTVTSAKLSYKVMGSGDTVLYQLPAAGSKILPSGTVMLYTSEGSKEQLVKVPNVIGKKASNANTMISNALLNIKITGVTDSSGSQAVKQTPEAGTMVAPGTVITVEFREIDAVD